MYACVRPAPWLKLNDNIEFEMNFKLEMTAKKGRREFHRQLRPNMVFWAPYVIIVSECFKAHIHFCQLYSYLIVPWELLRTGPILLTNWFAMILKVTLSLNVFQRQCKGLCFRNKSVILACPFRSPLPSLAIFKMFSKYSSPSASLWTLSLWTSYDCQQHGKEFSKDNNWNTK